MRSYGSVSYTHLDVYKRQEGGHTYLSGSIVLKSHVELVVETGAVLKASEDLNDYQYISELAKRGHDHMVEVPTFVNCEYDGKPRQYFIYSRDTDGVRISGGGVIDGSEEIYYGEVREDQIDEMCIRDSPDIRNRPGDNEIPHQKARSQ